MRVLLVVPPFGLIEYPHLATSLLKAEVTAAGFECDLLYASVEFARRIGFDTYRWIYTLDAQLLIPERIFAQSLFGDRIPPWNTYWQEVIAAYERPIHTHLRTAGEYQPHASLFGRFQQDAAEYVEELAARPELSTYDVIGFSTSYGQNCAALSLAKRVKARYPRIPIVFGGANCSGGMGETMLRLFPFVDYVCIEDGDVSFPQLLRQIEAGVPVRVPGIICRADVRGGAGEPPAASPPVAHEMVGDLDALPYPDFSDYFDAFRFDSSQHAEIVALPMETSRGCWWGQKHHCIFCGLNRDSMAYRQKSAKRIDAEIRHLVRRYGVKKMMMTDNIMSRAFIREGASLLAEAPEHEQIFFEVKANFTKEELCRLKAARVDHLQPGIESLSTHVLAVMKKGVDALQNLQVLKWSTELGIRVSWNILCGFPGETAEDYERMAALIPLIHHLQPPLGFAQITIDRFSPLFMEPQRFGIRLQPARAYRYVYPFSQEDLRSLAYWFSHDSAAVTLAAPAYAKSSYQAHLIWRRFHSRAELSYDYRTPDSISIVDSRGAGSGDRTLDLLETRVFETLDQKQTLRGVMERLSEVLAAPPAEAAVGAVIERFRDWHYIYEEDGKMLALATRRTGLSPAQVHPFLPGALGNERALPAS